MTQEQLILFKRSINIYNTETEAWTALDNLTHTQGQPVVAFFRKTSNTHGDAALGAIFAIGTDNGVGKYKACSSHDDMLDVAQALNTHISEWTAFKAIFDKMFEYDANHEAIKAKLDFYTDSNKNISAGGLGGSGSSSLGALYQLIDVMINSTGDGVEGAVEGSVLAYNATAGKWKAIAQSEILPNMSDYYTKDETDAAINAIPIYSMSELSASEIANLSDGANVREAYRLKKGGSNVDDTVIKIYKDSAIKSLELRDNKYLVLTYTDNEGNEQSISKDLSVIVNDNYVDLINNQEIGGIKTFTEKTIFKKDINVFGDAVVGGEVAAIVGEGTSAWVTDYAQLQNKPAINGKELISGNNTLDELGIQPKGDYTTTSQLDTILKNYVTKVFASNNYASKSIVNDIQALIPTTATADNQLADKDFVNSSIATATAEFKGSFTSLDDLKATSGNLNDYAFYLHTDDVGNKVVDRYKWTTAGWLYEYTLNNSSFTAEQWAALNSAITATLVQSYNSHLKDTTIHITSAERNAWNNKWDYNEETIKGVKVNAAISADKLTTDEGTSAIPIYFKNGKPAQCIPSDLFSGFDNAYSSTGEHSLGITIAGHTRMVVVAYSTLSEKANKLATPRTLWGRPFDGSANVDGDLKDVGNITASGKATIQGDIISGGEVVAVAGEGTPAGVTDYSALTGKPSINGVTLVSGNNTLAALGIQAAGDYATNSGVTTLLADYAKKTFVSNNYVGKSAFNSHTADSIIHITSAERAAWNAKWDYNENTIKAVKVTAASSADSVAWSGISGKPSTFTPSAHTHTASEVSGLPTSLKNPYALTFGSKTYDGSAAKTITASDLGALTAHQTIYALTLKVNGTSQGVYNPASAAKIINIAVPTKTSQITNDSGFITSAAIPTALKNPHAVEIKANGVSLGTYDGSKAATFNLSAANVGAANKVHSHTASEISGLPTKLSAFTNDVGFITGITKPMVEGVLTGDITSHTHSYLPLSGGTLTSANPPLYINRINGVSSILYQVDGITVGVLGFNENGTLITRPNSQSNANYYNIIHSNNYNSYSPTLTGTGASGTWGINISGNAATATNADTLDGHHETEFYRAAKKYISSGDIAKLEAGSYYNDDNLGDINPLPYTYSSLSVLGKSLYSQQLCVTHNATRAWLRGVINSSTTTVSDWHELAFTDSNVASATKLQTPRTIWGQSFDGSGDVNGNLNLGFSKLYWNGDIEGSYISSNGTTSMIYNMRDGHIFQVNGDEILRIRKYGYKLQVNGETNIRGDLIVDGEVSALVA